MKAIFKSANLESTSVNWFGDMPSHWTLLPNRALFSEMKEVGYPDEQLLSVTIAQGVVLQEHIFEDESRKDVSRLDKSNYKFVQPGDIVYNKMRAWQGAIGVSQHQGIVSPAYIVQRPRALAFSAYFGYLYRTPMFAKEAEKWSYGIASDMWSLRPEHFKMIYSCVPPLKEQKEIVKYLDYADQIVRGGGLPEAEVG